MTDLLTLHVQVLRRKRIGQRLGVGAWRGGGGVSYCVTPRGMFLLLADDITRGLKNF